MIAVYCFFSYICSSILSQSQNCSYRVSNVFRSSCEFLFVPNSSRLQLLSLLYTRPLLLLPSFSCSLPSIQQMNCLCGGLESVAEVIGLRQGHVCLELQGAECQSGLFSFQPRHLKNFKGGRDRRRGTLTQTEKLCFPSHFNNTLNL